MKQPTLIRIALLLALLGTTPALFAQTGSGEDSKTLSWTVDPRQDSDSLQELKRRLEENSDVVWSGSGAQKVRIGITMDSPSEALASQLGVDREKTVLITQVFDGMPAAKAGLKRFDLVVAVDGKTPATGEAIRQALSGKKAGDILKLEVLRKGARLSLEIAVEKADQAGNLSTGYVLDSKGTLQPFARITFEAQQNLEKALRELQTKQMDLKELELKIPQLKNLHLDEVGKILGEVKVQLGKIEPGAFGLGYSFLPNEGGKFKVFLTPRVPNVPGAPGPGGFPELQFPRPGFAMPSPPAPPAAMNPDIEKRLDRLEERMDKMMEMLQKYLDRTR